MIGIDCLTCRRRLPKSSELSPLSSETEERVVGAVGGNPTEDEVEVAVLLAVEVKMLLDFDGERESTSLPEGPLKLLFPGKK